MFHVPGFIDAPNNAIIWFEPRGQASMILPFSYDVIVTVDHMTCLVLSLDSLVSVPSTN